MLYNADVSTMSTVVLPAIAIHAYVDDHALKKEFNSSIPQEEVETAKSLSNCLNKVKEWMNSCHLKMNSDKTKVILFGSWQQIKQCRLTALEVCRESIPYSESIKYLGVCIDHNLCLHHYIASKCKTAIWNLFKIVNIRNFLTTEAFHTTVLATVISNLDYVNATMVGFPEKHIAKLQHVQNMAAKVVLRGGKYTSSTDSLQTLQWLPIRSWIDFKIAVLVYKCLHGEAPDYLQNLIITYIPRREGLRSEAIINRLIGGTKKKKQKIKRAIYKGTNDDDMMTEIKRELATTKKTNKVPGEWRHKGPKKI